MLKSLHISNYVIIDDARIDFSAGLNMITGETGAGKSLLLGALSLVLGRRADTQVLYDAGRKVICEAVFDDEAGRASDILREHDLDAGEEVILRREIAGSGRSRAFINDTPVTLDVMLGIASSLIDIHEQFESLEIQQAQQQYAMLDAFCGITTLVQEYAEKYQTYKLFGAQLESLTARQASAMKEKDYLQFQLAEFEGLDLQPENIAALEEEYSLQSGAQDIRILFEEVIDVLGGENTLTDRLRAAVRGLSKYTTENAAIRGYVSDLEALLSQCLDTSKAMSGYADKIEPDPQRKAQLEERLDAINRLLLKHGARDAQELSQVQMRLADQYASIGRLDNEIAECREQIAGLEKVLKDTSSRITKARKKGAPEMAKTVTGWLRELGMKHARLHIAVELSDQLHAYGADALDFLFAANLGDEPKPVKKVASGGELSRLNLCLKRAVSGKMELPTLVFDEIDAGISGEIAIRMGVMLRTLAQRHQVIMITHSPQIAAQAGLHLQVAKKDVRGRSIAAIRPLAPDERILEIAKMLSGDPPTKAAMLNARELIAIETN